MAASWGVSHQKYAHRIARTLIVVRPVPDAYHYLAKDSFYYAGELLTHQLFRG